MKVSNTQTVIICYLTQEEIDHLGGYGTPVTLKYSSTHWTIQADKTGDKTVCHGGRTASMEYPGRVNARVRRDLPPFGATPWVTKRIEGRTIVATIGSMAQPMRITGRLAKKVREAREIEQEARIQAGQKAALERHALMETMSSGAAAEDKAVVTNGNGHEPTLKSISQDPRSELGKGVSLREAIELVNKHKDKLGHDLVLEITSDGYLSGLVGYGRQRPRSSEAEVGAR